jgi:hypothetical protein
MSEKDTIFKTKLKVKDGIYNYGGFYKFCYQWLTQEVGLGSFAERAYSEKVSGDSKEIDIKWEGMKNISDYFRMEVKITFKFLGLKKIEAMKEDGTKVRTNQVASTEMDVKGILVRDYKGKFETSGIAKFWRGIYERWVIPERIDQIEDKVSGDLDEFVGQVKAYFALEGNTVS